MLHTPVLNELLIGSHLDFILMSLSLMVEHKDPPVACVVRAGVVYPYDDEDMLKVRANGPGSERVSPWLLEHNGHNVVPNVAFPQQLGKKCLLLEKVTLKAKAKPSQKCGTFCWKLHQITEP